MILKGFLIKIFYLSVIYRKPCVFLRGITVGIGFAILVRAFFFSPLCFYHQRLASLANFPSGLVPKGKVAIWPPGTAVKPFSLSGQPLHYFSLLAFWAGNVGGNKNILLVFALGKLRAGIEFAKPAEFDIQRALAERASLLRLSFGEFLNKVFLGNFFFFGL